MSTRRSVALMIGAALLASSFVTPSLTAQQPTSSPLHARAQRRLLIRNAMVIYGSARPPFGPVDIIVEDGVISSIGKVCRMSLCVASIL